MMRSFRCVGCNLQGNLTPPSSRQTDRQGQGGGETKHRRETADSQHTSAIEKNKKNHFPINIRIQNLEKEYLAAIFLTTHVKLLWWLNTPPALGSKWPFVM